MENVIVRSKIKEFTDGLSISSDFSEALNEEVIRLIKKAVERAKVNSRRTVMARDI